MELGLCVDIEVTGEGGYVVLGMSLIKVAFARATAWGCGQRALSKVIVQPWIEAGERAAGGYARLLLSRQDVKTGMQNNNSDCADDVRKQSLIKSVFENAVGISCESFFRC